MNKYTLNKFLALLLLSYTSLFANIYTFNPIYISQNTTCFIGDLNPPMKHNKGLFQMFAI